MKFKACVVLVLGLLAQDPPTYDPVATAELASRPPQTGNASSCGNPRHELRFEMLNAGAEPQLPTVQGLPVCLAVYRVQEPAPQ